MRSRAFINHLLGVALSAAFVLVVMFAAFFLSMITSHNGPASDYSFSKLQVFAADAGYATWRVLLWPGHHVTSTIGAWFVSSVVYGFPIYGLFIALTKKANRQIMRCSESGHRVSVAIKVFRWSGR